MTQRSFWMKIQARRCIISNFKELPSIQVPIIFFSSLSSKFRFSGSHLLRFDTVASDSSKAQTDIAGRVPFRTLPSTSAISPSLFYAWSLNLRLFCPLDPSDGLFFPGSWNSLSAPVLYHQCCSSGNKLIEVRRPTPMGFSLSVLSFLISHCGCFYRGWHQSYTIYFSSFFISNFIINPPSKQNYPSQQFVQRIHNKGQQNNSQKNKKYYNKNLQHSQQIQLKSFTMSYYSSFYNTLNALQAENQSKRKSVAMERSSPYTSQFIDTRFPLDPFHYTENSLRRSRQETTKIELDNLNTRDRIQIQLIKSTEREKEAQRRQLIEKELQTELVEAKHREKLDALRAFGQAESNRLRSSHLEDLQNSRRKVMLTKFSP